MMKDTFLYCAFAPEGAIELAPIWKPFKISFNHFETEWSLRPFRRGRLRDCDLLPNSNFEINVRCKNYIFRYFIYNVFYKIYYLSEEMKDNTFKRFCYFLGGFADWRGLNSALSQSNDAWRTFFIKNYFETYKSKDVRLAIKIWNEQSVDRLARFWSDSRSLRIELGDKCDQGT